MKSVCNALVKLCLSFDLYMGITFAILSFDGKTPVSIDLLLAMLSGDDMAYLILFIILYSHYHVHCFFLDVSELIIFIISVSSLGRK